MLTTRGKNLWPHRQYSGYALAMLTAFFFAAGCGDNGPERVTVSGMVLYKGKPLPDGMIRFTPTADTDAPMTGVNIKDGAYKVEGRAGVPVGTFKVQIEAFRPVHVPDNVILPPDIRERILSEQYIPPKYNTKTNLEITIAPGSQPITKDFSLSD